MDWRQLTGLYLPLAIRVDLIHGSDLVTAETAIEIAEYALKYAPDARCRDLRRRSRLGAVDGRDRCR